MKPLEGITILDFSQFLSAPSATLRLADFGARVIKVERPDGGDICRTRFQLENRGGQLPVPLHQPQQVRGIH